MIKKHNCWGSLDGVYKWIPRTANPKSCPRCKKRLDSKFKKGHQPKDEEYPPLADNSKIGL